MWRICSNTTSFRNGSISAAHQAALLCPARCVASYPTPGNIRSVKASRKKYNYLTNQRLVEKDKELRNRRLIRIKDDVFFHKRSNFRETVKKGVEEEIRYFSGKVKMFIFFKSKGSAVVNTSFHGARKLPSWLTHRILYLMEAEILKPANRDHLIKLIESMGVKPPTAAEWERYTDKKGNININLYHHKSVERLIRSFCLNLRTSPPLKLLTAYATVNRNNFAVCPPSRDWSLRQGPLRNEELVERGGEVKKRDMIAEIAAFQRPIIEEAFEKLSDAEKASMLEKAEARRKEIQREYERERVFAGKVMCGVWALKEIRAIVNPVFTYYNDIFFKALVRQGGSIAVTRSTARRESPAWFTLPKEQRLSYYCFSCVMEPNPVGGAHLYARYSTRDYGLTREVAMERWGELSDLQKAALNFCFYAPITPQMRSKSSFRNFYVKQCRRHGLVMTGRVCSNRAFHARVRKLWMAMTAEERAKYEDTEAFASVFPLQPQQRSLSRSMMNRNADEVIEEAKPTQLEVKVSSARIGTPLEEEKPDYTSTSDDLFYFEDEIIDNDEDDDGSGAIKGDTGSRVGYDPMPHHESSQMAFSI